MVRLFKHYVPNAVLMLGAVDVLLLIVAAEFGWIWRARQIGMLVEPIWSRLPQLVTFAGSLELAMVAVGAYGPRALQSMRYATARLLVAVSLGVLFQSVIFFLVPALTFWRSNLLYSMVAAVALLMLARLALGRMLDGETLKRRIVVLGAAPRAARLQALAAERGSGFVIAGFVAMNEGQPAVRAAVPRSAIANLADHVVERGAGEVVLALEERRNALPLKDLLRIRTTGVHVNDISSFLERETGRSICSRSTRAG